MIRERILYDNFVIPFMFGMAFVFVCLLVGALRVLKKLPKEDFSKFLISFLNPKIVFKDIRDILFDCLFHVKIFKRNKLLGYMHMSIAFGWFMLILIGHIEVLFYTPDRLGIKYLYYPVFFRYFTIESANPTMKGAFFFFLMDFFLLIVLSGIVLAIIKRIHSRLFGMRRTTRLSAADHVGLYALWMIFPLRLLAESFTAGISGGSFLTKPMNIIFSSFLSNDYHILPTWWAYSIAIGVFMAVLPFTRYMHIPTEIMLILLRNCGIKPNSPRYGYAETEIYSCPSCGLCIDACPMNLQKKNLRYSSVYFMRFMRRNNFKRAEIIADKCLQCGKCVQVCPVGIDSCALKIAQRNTRSYGIKSDFSYLTVTPSETETVLKDEKILYYGGCMTQLTPSISKSVISLLEHAGIKYSFLDRDGGICCGRPLMLSGKIKEAEQLISKNKAAIEASGATMLLVSCPICYKIFTEKYNLSIPVVHYTVYFNNLLKSGRLKIRKGESVEKLVYHDPCELGRGCGIYEQPREILRSVGELVSAGAEKEMSICCGGSLGSVSLSYAERNSITQGSVQSLMVNNPEKIVTACPLCLKTFSKVSPVNVEDIAQVLLKKIE